MKNKNLFFFGIALIIVILDQLTKYLVKSSLSFEQSISVIKNFFQIVLIKNFGIGFGLLNIPKARWILVIITIIIIGTILYYYKQIIKKNFLLICTALIFGGAIGNLIDRVLLGFVIDFLDFMIWPAFNIADSAITAGVIGLIIYFSREKK
ncbi:MAG: signal peptidase II [Candidatus Woesearchaeota archaeon]